jgi:hypothetical protein
MLMNQSVPSTSARPPRRRRRWLWVLMVALLAGLVAWPWLTLHWSYSDGERVGVLLKLSRKGYLCKTTEGELAMYVVGGIAPQIWGFSVRETVVADKLNAMLGKRVRLHYHEHLGVPTTCFGETTYYVDRVEIAPE